MSIKNRSVLEETKLLSMVKLWAKINDSDNEEKSQDIVNEIISEIVDQVFAECLENNDSNKLVTKSKQLFEKWNSLKVILNVELIKLK